MFVGLWWAAGILSGDGLGSEVCWRRRMGIRVSFFKWDFRGYEWVLWTFFFRWERMLFVRLLWTISRLVVMTGAIFEDRCQRHLERSGIRGKKMLWEAKRFVLG